MKRPLAYITAPWGTDSRENQEKAADFVGAKSTPFRFPLARKAPLRSFAPPLPTANAPLVCCGDPARAQRGGSRGERRSSEMSEPCRLQQGEGYGACDDAGQGRCRAKQKND